MRTCVRMRWSNLEMEAEERARLPGYREEAVIRHFDAPEAVETRFYEVRAKSILNRVPEASQVPFRWTINPFRGCTHSCTYCFARPTHKYLDFDAGRDFEREIVVKVNAPELLRTELARRSWTQRARGTRHEHRSVSVGRGTLQADAGDLGGDARRGESMLGAHEVSASPARPGADEADRRSGGVQRRAVGADRRRAGVAGDRTAFAEPAGAAGGGGGARPAPESGRACWWRR